MSEEKKKKKNAAAADDEMEATMKLKRQTAHFLLLLELELSRTLFLMRQSSTKITAASRRRT